MKQLAVFAATVAALAVLAVPASSLKAADQPLVSSEARSAAQPASVCKWLLFNGRWYCIPV